MSGHSKWATIKRAKGAADVRRGATFTKLSNAITLAVKQGGGITSPDSNLRLRFAIDSAKALNMPKDTIERAIERAAGRDAANFAEVIYEGYAPGGVALMVEAATDNVNRTSGEIKSLFNKAGASFGQPGAVAYLFEVLGMIEVNKNGKNIDDIFLSAAESGAQDIEDLGETAAVYTDPGKLSEISSKLKELGLQIATAEFTRKPTTTITLDPEQTQKVVDFLASIEDLEDVQKVYSNIGV